MATKTYTLKFDVCDSCLEEAKAALANPGDTNEDLVLALVYPDNRLNSEIRDHKCEGNGCKCYAKECHGEEM